MSRILGTVVGLLCLLTMVAWGCSGSSDEPSADRSAAAQPAAAVALPAGAASLEVSSPVFSEIRPRKRIPYENTCYGVNGSPPLNWSGVPDSAKSLALIAEDIDHQAGPWALWVLYNVPPTVAELAEGVSTSTEVLPDGTTQGTNDERRLGYTGPCPPPVVKAYAAYENAGVPTPPHSYVFTVYALDSVLDLSPAATKAELVSAMEGHILAQEGGGRQVHSGCRAEGLRSRELGGRRGQALWKLHRPPCRGTRAGSPRSSTPGSGCEWRRASRA